MEIWVIATSINTNDATINNEVIEGTATINKATKDIAT